MTAVPDPLTYDQLEAVVTDSGNVAELEDSTPGLAFASDVWTYMTSHILVKSPPNFRDVFHLAHLDRL